jgi:membrane protein implicated in regulation of membrane protease activity
MSKCRENTKRSHKVPLNVSIVGVDTAKSALKGTILRRDRSCNNYVRLEHHRKSFCVTIFLIIGAAGLGLIVFSLVVGEIFGDLFGDFDAGGFLSGPAIGAFLAAFGFGAALILSSTTASSALAALGGLGSGIVVGGVAGFFTRSLMNMPTDESVRSSDMTGLKGTVITRIPEEGLGEVSISFHGQLMKMSARSSAAVSAGTAVTVTAVLSPSSVVVEPTSTEA